MELSVIAKSIVKRSDAIVNANIIEKPQTAANFTQQFYYLYEPLFVKTNHNLILPYQWEDANSEYHLILALLMKMDVFIKYPIVGVDFHGIIDDTLNQIEHNSNDERLSDAGIIHASTLRILSNVSRTGQIKRDDLVTLTRHMTMLYYYGNIHMNDKRHLEKDERIYQELYLDRL